MHNQFPGVLLAAAATTILAVSGCSATSSSDASASSGATRGTATPSPTAALVDTCADTPAPVPPGSTTGTVVGTVRQGRILIAIEATQGGGTIALAYIDSSGLRVIPGASDFSTAHAAWGPNGTIVFDSERAGGRHLFRVSADGSGLVQVTKAPGSGEQDASFSPDGRRIAYEHYSCTDGPDFGIQVAAADGSDAVALNKPLPLHSPAYEQDAAFSPDGTRVAFVRGVDDTHAAIWVVPASGGQAQRLTSDDFSAAYPRWSPDGRSILFQGLASPGAVVDKLYVVPVAGGTPHRVFTQDAARDEFEGDWSPDGSQIVFKVYMAGWDHNELRTASADGTKEQTLWVGTMSTAETPHWGP